MFQLADLVFNQVSLLIEMLINLSLHFMIGARGNDGFTVSLFQFQDESLCLTTLVGYHISGREIFDEQFSLPDVIAFTAG